MKKRYIYKKAIKKAVKEAKKYIRNIRIETQSTSTVAYEFMLDMITSSIKKEVEKGKKLNKEFREYVKRGEMK
jgi:ribosomal protein S5